MNNWHVESPTVLDIDEAVTSLKVRLVAGHVDVVRSDGDDVRVEVSQIERGPVEVDVTNGVLTIRHERLSWEGVLGWLKSDSRRAVVSVAVPAGCTTNIGVVSASAVVAGLEAPVTVRCVSGDVTLDEVTGSIEVESVSGDVEGRSLRGDVNVKAVSGGLTLVGGETPRVNVKNVSGDVALDLSVTGPPEINVSTVSGDVMVRLPRDAASLRVDLASTSGDLVCGFDGLESERRPGSRRLRGTLGGGAGSFHGKTVSGRMSLLSRAGGESGS